MPWIFDELLIKGNPDSETAVLTLWTPKEKVAAALDKNSYAVIGQLYSKDQGINALLRNCLANKRIRHIVLTGMDLSKSGETLLTLMENGIDNGHKIIGTDVYMDKEIPAEAIELFRKNVFMHDQRNITDFSRLALDFPRLGAYGEPEIFPEAEIKKPKRYPADHSGFKVADRYIGSTWLEIIYNIMRFGAVKKSEHSDGQKEIINLVAVITEENPKEPNMRDFYTFSEKELEGYLPQVLTAQAFSGIAYTYGQRLRQGTDQIKGIAERLRRTPHTRRAVAIIWNPGDAENSNPPCLVLVQALAQDNKLFLTAYFRSHDIFGAWLMNAYALRALQYEISGRAGIEPGSLTIISNSAHIYEKNWNKALDILEKNPRSLKPIGDPYGNILIAVSDNHIVVTHLGPQGEKLEAFHGTTAAELYKKIALDKTISQVSHALDIGCELQKAELALKLGLKYVQDKPLAL